jgi:cell division protein ZipA
MDPDILRLILLVLGILVLLGIYFWGRTHGKNSSRAAVGGGRLTRDNEPVFGSLSSKDIEEIRTETEAFESPRMDLELEQLGEMVADERSGIDVDGGPELSPDLADPVPGVQQDVFPASEDRAWAAGTDSRGAALLQIIVVASKGRFNGQDIVKAGREIGLQANEMQIFHRFAPGSNRVLFSMASLSEPGSFPMESMGGFSTPGLTLFTQLPGPVDGLKVYSEMLEAAGRLAESLGGGLRDETHSALTKQTIEHTRGEILEHSRKLALARKRS